MIHLWKAIAEAGLSPSGVADAIATGLAGLAGEVAGVLHRLPNGKWQAVVHGPATAGLSRRELEASPSPAADDKATWLGVAEVASIALAPLHVEGRVWGMLAVGRLRKDDPFSAEDHTLLRQIADAAASVMSSALTYQRVNEVLGGAEGLDRWRQAFIEDCPSMIFLKDVDGRYVFINKNYEQVCGISRDQVLKQVDEQIFPAEQAAFFRAIDKQILPPASR